MASENAENSESAIVEEEEAIEENNATLMSSETMDRNSPELWPEKSMNEFMSNYSTTNNKLPYSKEVNIDDTNFINQLSILPIPGLIAKVKELHDVAYQLGIEEAKEMTRGKCLNIFDKSKKSG